MKVTIDSSVKEKVESVRLGCLVYDVKVKESYVGILLWYLQRRMK